MKDILIGIGLLVTAIVVGLTVGATLYGCGQSQEQINANVNKVVQDQMCVQGQLVSVCGPTVLAGLPAAMAGTPGVAGAAAADAACAMAHLAEANQKCEVFQPVPAPAAPSPMATPTTIASPAPAPHAANDVFGPWMVEKN